MVFQKWLSVILSVSILATPVSSVFAQEPQEDSPKPEMGEASIDAPKESRKLMRQFEALQEKVKKAFEHPPLPTVPAAPVVPVVEASQDFIEAFYVLKNFTEKVLNTPTFDWAQANTDFYISQLEDAMVKDVKGFEPILDERRVFFDRALANGQAPTLIEKEKIFLGFEEVRKEFDKAKIVFHWKGPLASYVKINFHGKQDFERFVSAARYYVIGQNDPTIYEVIPKLSDLQALEVEALAQDQSEQGWENLLKRVAIDLYLTEWVYLDSLWISSLHPPTQRLSLLPLSCQNQYQTLHPLTIPHLLAEKEKVASRALFEAQFYTTLRTDKILSIPIFVTEPMVRKLLGMVPSWKVDQALEAMKDPQKAEARVQRMMHLMGGLENQMTIYAISWYFQSQNEYPFLWQGTKEEIESKILTQLIAVKKILFLAVIERILTDSRATVSLEVKGQILELAQDMSKLLPEQEEFKAASKRIYEIYEESKTTLQAVEEELLHQARPKELVDDKIEQFRELSQKLIEQDQKIAQLKEGHALAALEDTPQNFKTASLVFAPQLTDLISKESFDEIKRVLFDEEETYEAAFHKYQDWVSSFDGTEKVKEDMKKVGSQFGLTHAQPLSQLFEDSQQRSLFETVVRGLLVTRAPLLEAEVEYEGHSKPFYVHFWEATEHNKPHAVFVELIQRAIWNKKQLVEYEVDRFCKLDPTSAQGMEYLLANTNFRKSALSKFPGFDKINETVMTHLHEELSEGKFEQAVGYGFLTVIGLSFVTGPLSRLPWWLGGRWIPAIPQTVLKVGHVFGMAAAPLAIWWMGEHVKRYFWEEEHVIDALENFNSINIEGKDNDAITVLDLLKEDTLLKDPTQGFRRHPDILKNKLDLRMAQVSFLLFAPVQYAFVRGMLVQTYGFYSQKLPFTRRVGISAALKKLYIPTRFWTFKPGNELLALPPEALRRAYLDAVDRSISVKKLTSYIETWTRLLTRQVGEHEARWGVGATWQETVQLIETNASKTWIPRHAASPSYFMRSEGLAQQLIAERQMLLVRLRLNQEALHSLQNQGASKVSEVILRERFGPALEELEMYFDQNLAQFYPSDELTWLISNIDTSRFIGLWFGGWVGVQGSLGYAIEKMAAYHYLASQRLPLLFSVVR